MADSKLTALTETSVPALDDVAYSVDVSDTTDDAAGSSRKLTFSRLLGLLNHVVQGRLTLESGVAVSTSDQTAKTTVYFTPYNGNLVSLYDGTRWRLYTFTERSLSLGTLTADKNYDVFLYDNSGTLTLELSAAWTNDTTRADALTTQDGVYVKSGATTRRYLGTIRTTSTTTTEDSEAKRFVWNTANQVRRPLSRLETTASWTYTTATWRQANASTANQLAFVAGMATHVRAEVSVYRSNSSGSVGSGVAVGVDSTTTPSGTVSRAGNAAAATEAIWTTSHYSGMVAAGYHYLAWLEISAATGTTTWQGASGTVIQSGITGEVAC